MLPIPRQPSMQPIIRLERTFGAPRAAASLRDRVSLDFVVYRWLACTQFLAIVRDLRVGFEGFVRTGGAFKISCSFVSLALHDSMTALWRFLDRAFVALFLRRDVAINCGTYSSS